MLVYVVFFAVAGDLFVAAVSFLLISAKSTTSTWKQTISEDDSDAA